MDEVVGLIVEQLARRAREAKQRAATASPGQAATPGAPAPPPPAVAKSRAASGNRGPNATRARAATQPVAPPPPGVFDGGLGALPSLDAADPFGGVGSAVAPIESASGASVATPLLADFTGGNAFLRAFVVSEALALPVALREPKLP